MLFKKLKKIIITLLSTLLILTSVYGGFTAYNKLIPQKQIEHKIDMTEFKIKQVMNTNKLQTLEVIYNVGIEDTDWDDSKILKNLIKALTKRHLIVTNSFKAVFNYNLDSASITKNFDGTYRIQICSKDVEVNVVPLGEAKVNERWGILGYYNSQDSSRVINELNKKAYSQINTQENIIKTLDNVKVNLNRLFQSVGIDINKIQIENFNNF